MDLVDAGVIRTFLSNLAMEIPEPSTITLLGGGALIMLGMPRTTNDIDYLGDDLVPGPLDSVIRRVAAALHVHSDPVPIERFVPVPADAGSRHVLLGQFGGLEAWAFDPLTIALSKVDRGFDTDLLDIEFLVRQGLIDLKDLVKLLETALERALEFDIDPAAARRNLETVRQRLAAP